MVEDIDGRRKKKEAMILLRRRSQNTCRRLCHQRRVTLRVLHCRVSQVPSYQVPGMRLYIYITAGCTLHVSAHRASLSIRSNNTAAGRTAVPSSTAAVVPQSSVCMNRGDRCGSILQRSEQQLAYRRCCRCCCCVYWMSHRRSIKRSSVPTLTEVH